MSYWTVKAKIDRALTPSETGAKPILTSTELAGIVAEAKKDGLTEGEKRIMTSLWERGYVKGAPAPSPEGFQLYASTQARFAEFFWHAKLPVGPATHLGTFSVPGPVLASKTFTVKPGESLKVTLPSSREFSIGAINADPYESVRTSARQLPNQSGATRLWEWTMQVPPDAKKGTLISLRTDPGPYANQGADWRFEFFIRVG